MTCRCFAVFLVAVILICSEQVMAQRRGGSCSLDRQTLVQLYSDPVTGRIGKTGVVLPPSSVEYAVGISKNATSFTSTNQDFQERGGETFFARLCYCAPDEAGEPYCPLESTHCRVPRYYTAGVSKIKCKTETRQQGMAIAVFIPCVVISTLLLSILFFTQIGRSAIDYAISFCVPSWQRFVMNRIADRDPTRTRRLLRSYGLRRRARLDRERRRQGLTPTTVEEAAFVVPPEEVETRQPTKLALKTRIYEEALETKLHVDSMDEDSQVSCTICFSPIEEGERVGALSCDHIFHVDCLKAWLSRRNVCPLCQQHDVAKPIYDDDSPEDRGEETE